MHAAWQWFLSPLRWVVPRHVHASFSRTPDRSPGSAEPSGPGGRDGWVKSPMSVEARHQRGISV